MTLLQRQHTFSSNVAKLIQHANSLGYEITFGEAMRTRYQQEKYVKEGKSKTMNSRHLVRLAIDLLLYIDTKYLTDNESYKPLADFWKSLHPDNVAGYDWGWDAQHFEMKPH